MKKPKIPSAKKKRPDRIEGLVAEHLANIAAAEETFRGALELLEKYKTEYPELDQYAESGSPPDRFISLVDNVKDSKHGRSVFKIAIAGVTVAYQVTLPEEKGHSNVDRAPWVSSFEETLAKAITQIILARESEPVAK
jgi:hypothetical protein